MYSMYILVKSSVLDETDADPKSFIALECESTKKYSVRGSHGSEIPDKIFTDHFKDIANILKSGYFAKKVDKDNKQTMVSLFVICDRTKCLV